MNDTEYAAQVYANLDHTRVQWADYVALAGVPRHPTAPMAYSIYQIISREESVCGCIACFDKQIPSRR